MRCLLIGNYGVGNLGDEALRDSFLRLFPDVAWTVSSAWPSAMEVPRLPMGVRSFLRTPWWRTIRAFWQTDAVVFGGGSLFTDVESSFACLLWAVHAWLAFLFRKPVYLAFQGIGPFRTKRGEALARWVARHAAFISVRDAESVARMASWKMHTSCVLSADPVFLWPQKSHPKHTQNVLIVIPRAVATSSFLEAVRRAMAVRQGLEVQVLSLQPDDVVEQQTIAALVYEFGATVVPIVSYGDLVDHLAGASFVVTQRYHGAIAALLAGVPQDICFQGEGDKLWALRQKIEQGNALHELENCRSAAKQGVEALQAAFVAQRSRKSA